MQISDSMAEAMCQAAADQFLVEEDADPFQLVFYAGEMAAMDIPRDDLTPLVVFDMPSPAFGAIVVTEDQVQATGFTLPEVMAVTSGTIAWWRVYTSTNDALMQEEIDGGTITVSTIEVVEGNVVEVESFVLAVAKD